MKPSKDTDRAGSRDWPESRVDRALQGIVQAAGIAFLRELTPERRRFYCHFVLPPDVATDAAVYVEEVMAEVKQIRMTTAEAALGAARHHVAGAQAVNHHELGPWVDVTSMCQRARCGRCGEVVVILAVAEDAGDYRWQMSGDAMGGCRATRLE